MAANRKQDVKDVRSGVLQGAASVIGGAIMSAFPIVAIVNFLEVDTWTPKDWMWRLLGVAILLAVLAAICVWIWERISKGKAANNVEEHQFVKTGMRLRYYEDNRTPVRSEQFNIYRWYTLRIMRRPIGQDGRAEEDIFVSETIFIIFDKEIPLGQVTVTSPDFRMPGFEIKDRSNRGIVINFFDKIPEGELVIETSPP